MLFYKSKYKRDTSLCIFSSFKKINSTTWTFLQVSGSVGHPFFCCCFCTNVCFKGRRRSCKHKRNFISCSFFHQLLQNQILQPFFKLRKPFRPFQKILLNISLSIFIKIGAAKKCKSCFCFVVICFFALFDCGSLTWIEILFEN